MYINNLNGSLKSHGFNNSMCTKNRKETEYKNTHYELRERFTVNLNRRVDNTGINLISLVGNCFDFLHLPTWPKCEISPKAFANRAVAILVVQCYAKVQYSVGIAERYRRMILRLLMECIMV